MEGLIFGILRYSNFYVAEFLHLKPKCSEKIGEFFGSNFKERSDVCQTKILRGSLRVLNRRRHPAIDRRLLWDL